MKHSFLDKKKYTDVISSDKKICPKNIGYARYPLFWFKFFTVHDTKHSAVNFYKVLRIRVARL